MILKALISLIFMGAAVLKTHGQGGPVLGPLGLPASHVALPAVTLLLVIVQSYLSIAA